MSILDNAIREHLELKRAHGADEAELKRLEDEAFGPAERPDAESEQDAPFAEAPTEFLTAPGADEETQSSGRRINVADLQEPPPPKEVEPEASAEDAAAEGPAEEEHPAMEHKTIAEPAAEEEPPSSADQPTELFDVEGQFEDAEVEVSGPVDDEPEDEFDEFFSEQRLSDELNQALEAPLPDEPGAPATDETASPFLDPDSELGPTPEAEPEPDSREDDLPDEPRDEAGASEGDADEHEPHEPGHVDALEDTPEFLEESPEDDDAWFEQKPPKDFDFGD